MGYWEILLGGSSTVGWLDLDLGIYYFMRREASTGYECHLQRGVSADGESIGCVGRRIGG